MIPKATKDYLQSQISSTLDLIGFSESSSCITADRCSVAQLLHDYHPQQKNCSDCAHGVLIDSFHSGNLSMLFPFELYLDLYPHVDSVNRVSFLLNMQGCCAQLRCKQKEERVQSASAINSNVTQFTRHVCTITSSGETPPVSFKSNGFCVTHLFPKSVKSIFFHFWIV